MSHSKPRPQGLGGIEVTPFPLASRCAKCPTTKGCVS